MVAIETALQACDLFVAIGTSGTVYPAAGFAATAHGQGARIMDFNLELKRDRSRVSSLPKRGGPLAPRTPER
jgi:NAD-dependent deacetylase